MQQQKKNPTKKQNINLNFDLFNIPDRLDGNTLSLIPEADILNQIWAIWGFNCPYLHCWTGLFD